MILVSCIAFPWITELWGTKIQTEASGSSDPEEKPLGDRVLVPVANPSTEDNLLNLALILAKNAGGTLLPLHVLSRSERTNFNRCKSHQQQTQPLAAELKAKLQILQVLAGVRSKQFDLSPFGLIDGVPIHQEQGSLISKVNKLLKTDDLLVLIASPKRLGQPAVGRVPEAITRSQTQISILVIHFPNNS